MSNPVPLARETDDFVVGTLYYNGVNFPPARKMKATYEPVYDSSKRVVKYVQGSVTIECMMYPGFLEDPVAFPGGGGAYALPYHIAGGVSTITSGGNDTTMDTTMATIRHRLAQPCQWLKIDSQGFGSINLNSPSAPSPKDVNNGPKPKIVKWTPYTNKMALVEWTVEFCFSPCDSSDGSHRYQHNTCEFAFEVSIELDEKGLSTRTNSGKYEIPLTRKPTINAVAGPSQDFDLNQIEKNILAVFPRKLGFKRVKQSFVMSRDRKFVDFVIVDAEINSDDAYGEGIAHADVKVSTSSSYKDGGYFSIWNTTLDGTLMLIPGYSKIYAWKEIARLYDRYCISIASKGEKPLHGATGSKYNLQSVISRSGGSTSSSYAILRTVKYVDNVFDRSVQFSYSWDLYVSTATLFKATGLFLPVDDTQHRRTEGWSRWRANTSNSYDKGGWQGLSFTPGYDIIVGLCDAWNGISPPGVSSEDRTPMPESSNPPGSNKKVRPKKFEVGGPPSPTDSAFYSIFHNMFIVDIAGAGLTHMPVFSLPAVIEGVSNNFDRLTDPNSYPQEIYPANSDTSLKSSGVPKPIHHRVGPPRTTITMIGYAERLGAPPQVPYVESISDDDSNELSAYKVGTDRIVHFDRGSGIDMLSGQDYSIHGTYWQKSYSVAGYPTHNIIKSDGHKSGIYQG